MGNREPILCAVDGCPETYGNNVGLTNPGAKESARQLAGINFPKDKFLLASIFGRTPEEFVYVAKTLEERVDGFEENLSCPHVKGHGMVIGQDPDSVYKFTKAVRQATKKPIFAKLTPNTNKIGEIAQAAIRAGADGIVAINTVGPGYYSVDGNPVLTNIVGGLSGRAIKPIGLKCVRDIRQAVGEKPLIIGMGGIRTARDIEDYIVAGANVYAPGSAALAGMDDEQLRRFYPAIVKDIEIGEDNASTFLQDVNMEYKKVRITEKEDYADDFKIFRTNSSIDALPGQFVFAWLPGVGEKPFSIMDDEPLNLGVQERGEFTRAFNQLKRGDSFYIRGPYGKGINPYEQKKKILVAGGSGIAGISLIAKTWSYDNPRILIGAKDRAHIPYLKQLTQWGEVYIATEDGSLGKKGLVTDLFSEANVYPAQFYNCGPKAMIDAVLPLEKRNGTSVDIYSSLDYITSCGIGLCGKCADEKGRRTCVEGPFMKSF
jgi:dihydroorotate dehydrogenase subfamily 1